MALTRKERMALNKQLALVGRRICGDCGRNLPLDADHWYFRKDGTVNNPCRQCKLMRSRMQQRKLTPRQLARMRARYHERMQDPAWRAQRAAASRERQKRDRLRRAVQRHGNMLKWSEAS